MSGGYLWDDEPCPEEDCDGDLQQQDQFNVMCLACEEVWTHIKWDDERHELQTAEGETVATKRRTVMTDGGVESGGETRQEPLMLNCWNCPNEFESGSLGRPLGKRDASELCPRCGARFATPPMPEDEFEDIVTEPNQLPRYVLPDREVKRRLPAIKKIVDQDLRDEVIRLSARAPAYFWWVPAANPMSDYHHPICRERRGLWAHTLMGVTAVDELSESWEEQGRINLEERDYALAASILHDQRKKGHHGDFEDSSTSDHDLLMAEVIREESELPDEVADAVASHMGPWYDGPEPETPVQKLVHDADMMASTSSATLKVANPVPKELEEIGVEGY